jgi:hypothetical protein
MKERLKIAETLLANTGGFSINTLGTKPTHGYMVSIEGYERKIPDTMSPDEITYHVQRFVLENWDLVYYSRDLYFGAWSSDGVLFLDISENVPFKIEAEQLAKQRNQIAFYSVTTKETLFV